MYRKPYSIYLMRTVRFCEFRGWGLGELQEADLFAGYQKSRMTLRTSFFGKFGIIVYKGDAGSFGINSSEKP